jgi:hypothetical protein
VPVRKDLDLSRVISTKLEVSLRSELSRQLKLEVVLLPFIKQDGRLCRFLEQVFVGRVPSHGAELRRNA